ncbi:MAG: VWA domain-containing protein [Defluviitaleaceae bacterium]|nr:VWA domain-containing protein [Defluviitaleaceae bacterium]
MASNRRMHAIMQTVCVFVCIFVYLLFSVIFAQTLYASAAIPIDGIDAILVVDTSGSMRTADPERITLEAASLFMDMMETRSSRIGIIQFSDEVQTVMPLTPISDPSIRDNIRHEISQFVYRGWTDIGLALRTAAQMLLDDPVPGNSPMILLFTDGRIELAAGDSANDRTVELSYDDAWWAVDSVGDFASIYTIGLNHDGTINEEFLREIASRTGASYYIVGEADALPQIFNEIFASHIRSSITEVTTIVADGETYADVSIPIPSAFVAEANIIMLSSRPITSVRLFDPSGREVAFDDESYTLTYANRYSMIKVLEPMVGDWLLNVRGLPEDRITINLIYNYNVSIALSVDQPDIDERGPFFDPSYPIIVQAGFISPLPSSQIQTLFNESVAEMQVYDMQQNHVATFPMVSTGSSFVKEFQLDPPQDVRVSISITHPGFEQTSSLYPITYDPAILAEFITAQETEPEADPTPVQETPEPSPTPEDVETGNLLIFILIGIALTLAVAALVLRAMAIRKTRNRVFTGHLELRALLVDGNYTSLEAPDLNTFAGQMSLMEFLSNSLGGDKVDRLVQSGIPIWDIQLSPGVQGSQPTIHLLKKGADCQITDGDGSPIFKKKIVWEDGKQLIFSMPGESPQIEITYRAFED